MKRTTVTILGLLLTISILAFAFWPLGPAAPAASPVKNVADGQESFARHLELGLLYERNGILNKAQSEYEHAAESGQIEIVAAARNGLNRVLMQQQNPWLGLQAALRAFAQWIGENLLRLILVGAVVWLIWLLVARLPRRAGYLLLPFEDFTGDGLGKGLHDLIHLTLQEAQHIHLKGHANLLSSSEGLEVPLFATLSEEQDMLSNALSTLDSFSVGGIDLPLGKALLAARQWASTREHVITGSLHQHGESIRLSAEIRQVNSRQVLQVWELSVDTGEQPADQVASLTEELAFRILFYLCPQLEARAWRSLQLFTAALRETQRYGVEVMSRTALRRSADLLSKALVLDPGYTSAYHLLGIVYSKWGRYSEARDAFREVISIGDRLVVEATYNLGLAFYHEFQDWAYGQSIARFEEVQKILSEDRRDERWKLLLALAHCGLASTHAQRIKAKACEETNNALALVERHCQTALSLAEDRPEIQAATHNALGIAHLKAGQTEEAVYELKAAIRARPGYPVPYVYLAQAYADDRPDEAIRWLEQAVKWHPGYEYAYFQLGKTYQQYGEIEAAKKAYVKAPGIPDAHNSLGQMLAAEGEYERALAEFHEVVRLNSRHSRGWRNLAWWTVESGERDEDVLKEATGWARRALELDRGTPYEWRGHDALGRVLFHRGHLDKAEEAFRLSISARKGKNQIQNRYHLAHIYRERGETDKARQTLEEALELEEHGYWRDKAIALIQQLRQETT